MIPVLIYLFGLGVFGFIRWIMDGILEQLEALGVHQTGPVYIFLNMVWTGALVVYLIFGGIWLIRKYDEREYIGGYY